MTEKIYLKDEYKIRELTLFFCKHFIKNNDFDRLLFFELFFFDFIQWFPISVGLLSL
jgi:hypothetical protein